MSGVREAEQDAWCGDVLGFLPPARNRGPVRLELNTRRTTIKARLDGIVGGVPQAAQAEVAAAVNRRVAEADQVLGTVSTDDTTPPGEFVRTVKDADKALGGLADYVPEARKLADEAGRRTGIRDRLEEEHRKRLAEQGRQQAIVLEFGSPGAKDMDIRQPQDAARQALATPAFRSNIGAGFDEAATKVRTSLDGMKGAEDELKKRADDMLPKVPALRALKQVADRARDLAGDAAFGGTAAALAASLGEARNTLLAATGADAAGTGQDTADAAARKVDAIAAAAQAHTAVADPVAATADAADKTAGAALHQALADALALALEAVADGGDGATPLNRVAAKVDETAALTRRAQALRQRGEMLATGFTDAGERLSTDQKAAVGDVAALNLSLADIATADSCGKLETTVGEAETALKNGLDAVAAYDALRGRLVLDGAGLPVAANAKVDGPALFTAALETADAARGKEHRKGQDALEALDTNLEPLRSICTGLAAVDAGLGIKLVADAVKAPLATLQTGIKAGLNAKNRLAGLERTLQQVTAHVTGWQAYDEALSGIDMEPTRDIPKAVTDNIRGWPAKREELLGPARKAADAGNADKVREVLGSVKEWSANLRLYLVEGAPTLTEAARLDGKLGPANGLVSTLVSQANTAVSRKDFGAAGAGVATLKAILGPVQTLSTTHGNARKAVDQVAGTGSKAMAAENATQDKDLEARLANQVANLKADPGNLKTRTDELVELAAEARQALAARQGQMRGDVATAVGDDKAAAAFADPDTATQAGRLYGRLGPDGLAKLLSQVGDGSGGTKAVTRMVKDLGTLSPEQMTMLLDELGGPAMLARLCGANGSTLLPHTLAMEFGKAPKNLGNLVKGVGNDPDLFLSVTGEDAEKARSISEKFKPADLRSLLRDGFGDDPAKVKGVFAAGDNDGKQAKALSDAFTDRTQLATLTADLGGADAGPVMKKLALNNFGGDWAKLKTPFFDEIGTVAAGNAAVRTKLISNAQHFLAASPPHPAVNAHGFGNVAVEHVYKRHVSENFDFNDIKETNTQFARDLIPDVPAICGAAIGEVRGLLDWLANPVGPPPPGAVELNPAGGAFRKFRVNLPPPFAGMALQVGFEAATNSVDQIFPLAGIQFSNAEMTALKKALNK